MSKIVMPFVRGDIAIDSVDDIDGTRTRLAETHNQVQYQWAVIAAECIGKGNRKFRINAMYLEFENVANPDTVVTIPTFDRDENIDYYDALQSSGTRDYLRVPLLLPPGIDIATGFEDYFTAGVNGNRLTFYTQSQGTAGVHGKAFSHTVNSKICGVGLIATPEFNDPSQDVIFSRSYLSSGAQAVKQASKSLGITWRVVFG